MHFCFALGSIFGPLLCEPFLAVDFDKSNLDLEALQSRMQQESRIFIPYTIFAVLSVITAFLHFVLLQKISYTQENSAYAEIPQGNHSDTGQSAVRFPRSYVITVIILGALVLLCEGGIECNTFNFLQTFVNNIDLKLSTQKVYFYHSHAT